MQRWNVEQIVKLAGDIYEVANNQSEWIVALDRMCDAFGGSRTCIQRFDGIAMPGHSESNVHETSGLKEELASGGYSYVMPLTQILISMPHGSTYHERSRIDCKAWHSTPVWQDLMAPRDMYGGAGCRLNGAHGADEWWIFDIQRGRSQADFSAEDMRVLDMFVPALSRAFQIGPTARHDRASGFIETHTFDRLPTGMAVVSKDLKTLRLNQAAETLIERYGLRVSHGMLMTGDAAATRQLHALVSDACYVIDGLPGSGGDMLLKSRDDETAGLILSIVPMVSGSGHAQFNPTAAIYMRETHAKPDAGFARRVSSLFGLSQRESEVAERLVEGLSLKEISEAQAVSITTVRTHVASLFRKTGTNRQSRLVAMLGRISELHHIH
ncbi:LuxR C-terminal-related transcriptional regulator [Mesorhizobium sp. CAU 1732]|uniref:helix-turn-helix transcriptional regulator n=1 Tax=Mesorhizobium sp. CAU 1732 TaxID=3140358 RepID=UPI0032612247